MKTKNQTTTQSTFDEGETAANRFKDFVKQVVSVPKEEIDKREAEYQSQRVVLRRKPATKKKPTR